MLADFMLVCLVWRKARSSTKTGRAIHQPAPISAHFENDPGQKIACVTKRNRFADFLCVEKILLYSWAQ
jgi:hypothetical protein